MRVHSHHLHLPHFHIDSNKDLNLLYGIRVIRNLANALVYLFFPIFLYQTSPQLPFLSQLTDSRISQGLLLVAGYFFLSHLLKMFSALPAGRLVSRLGYHRMLVYAYLVRIVVFLCLYLSQFHIELLVVALILDSVQSVIFWSSYYTLVSKSALKKHMGSDLGLLQFLLQLIAAITPAVVGVVATYLGYEYLFLIGLIGPVLAIILSLQLSFDHETDQVSLKEFENWLTEPGFRQLSLANLGRYWNDLALYVWPLYIFFLLGGIDKVGYVQTIAIFISIVTIFFIGSYLDGAKSKKPFYFSGSVLALVWAARSMIVSVWHIALSDVIDRLMGNFHWLFFDSILFRRGQGKQALSYFIYREIIFAMAGMLFWGVAVATFLLTSGWLPLFGLAVIGSLASTLVSEKHQAKAMGHV